MARTTESYILLSYVALAGLVAYAFHSRLTFYHAMAYLYASKAARLSAANAGLATLVLLGRILQRVLLGSLRFVEVERMHLRAREAIIESFLAMTVFSRHEFNARFLVMFSVMFFIKAFHWLCYERLNFVEQQAAALAQPRRTHLRLVALFILLHLSDVGMLAHCLRHARQRAPSIMAMFAFEYAILLIGLLSHSVRYAVFVVDMVVMRGRSWDNKGMFLFVNELVSTFLQLCAYFAFFAYVHLYYSLPIHIMRDMGMTFRHFRRRLADFIRYRRVVRSMHAEFADASEEELASGDRTCIICREEMHGGSGAKKLHCGHIFHVSCLRSWMERSMSCPTCRREIRPVRNESSAAATPASPLPRPAGRPEGRPEVPPAGASASTSPSAATPTVPTGLPAHTYTLPPPPPPPPEVVAWLEQALAAHRAGAGAVDGSGNITPTPALRPSPASPRPTSSGRRSSVTLREARQLQRQLDDLTDIMRNLIQRLESDVADGDTPNADGETDGS
ncbi:hypothetical protein CDCA_CDCA13G3574 [Cyanidium caldarium]|uniref:RING-type E3 ubiquitin transferase n=1 Tax=Cyanidium caldarium TaxID=2771 RepID=A0AAV9IZ16_CYACA|nr:hypothetical protein CDCA_CDCA13G3574 [Cyanidium caldarium]